MLKLMPATCSKMFGQEKFRTRNICPKHLKQVMKSCLGMKRASRKGRVLEEQWVQAHHLTKTASVTSKQFKSNVLQKEMLGI